MALKLHITDFWTELFDCKRNVFTHILEKYGVPFELCNNPDLLIHGGMGSNRLKFDCPTMFFTGEAATTTYDSSSKKCITDIHTDFIQNRILSDYVMGFERKQTPWYLRFPLYAFDNINYKLHNVPILKEQFKDKFCIYPVYNLTDDKIRLIKLISEISPVHVSDNNGTRTFIKETDKILPHDVPWWHPHISRIVGKCFAMMNFKFSLCVEKTPTMDGYITEKLIDAIRCGVVPIYYGNDSISTDFHTSGFINVSSIRDNYDFLEEIRRVDSDKNEYERRRTLLESCRKISDEEFELGFVKFIQSIR